MGKNKIGAGLAGILLLGAVAGTALCVEKIPTGYVGVQYSMSGGVQDDLLTQGWHIVAPNKKVNLYSIRTEQLYMSRDKQEGSKDDDSFNIMTKDGTLNVDFEMAYSFDSEDVVGLFNKYGGLSGEDIVNTKVRGKIKTLISEVTTQYTVLDVHMEKKAEVNKAITEYLRDELKRYGITVESATLSRTQPSAEVEQAIIKRTTTAQELEAEKQKQEKVALEAETKRIEAQGKADAKLIEAQAEAEANRLLEQSITPELIEMKRIEKWNGSNAQTVVNGAESTAVVTGGN